MIKRRLTKQPSASTLLTQPPTQGGGQPPHFIKMPTTKNQEQGLKIAKPYGLGFTERKGVLEALLSGTKELRIGRQINQQLLASGIRCDLTVYDGAFACLKLLK